MSGAGSGLSETSRRQLLALLEKIASVAERIRPTARVLTGIAAVSALWLAYRIQFWTDASLPVTGIVLFVLAVPALVCGWLWWLLVDVSELPQVAERALGILRPAPAPGAAANAGVGEVFRMGGSLRQALKLAWEFDSLRGVIVGVLVLANPLFLAVLGFSLVAGLGLGLVAILTGLTALL